MHKKNYGTSVLKKMMMQKLLGQIKYSRSVYYDFVYPMIFPLIKDSVYVFRDEGDPNEKLFMRQKFLGIENITIPIGTYWAYKYRYLTMENLATDSLYVYSWIGTNGLLKRLIEGAYTTITDSLANTIGVGRTLDILELIGKNDINPDTLKPWGKK